MATQGGVVALTASGSAAPSAPATSFRVWTALIGIVGVVMQVFSFSINPGPPAGSTIQQIVAWGQQNANLVLAGAWTQGVSSFLIVFFTFGLVYLAGETARPLGWITLLASAVLVAVSMIECTYYISAVQGGVAGDLAVLTMSLQLIRAIQHAYVIAPATAFMASLGLVIVRSRVVPAVLGYLALAIGAILEVLGLIGLFTPLQPVIDGVLTGQELLLLVSAVALLVGALRGRAVPKAAPSLAV